MSLKMAVGALQTLAKDHIWVLKATWKKEKLAEKVKTDIPWALQTVIRSFGNSCDSKRIKAELCPGVLTEKEWSAWNTKARKVLESDPTFGTSPDNIDIITIRERPISVSEKLYNAFKAERNFFDRVAVIRSYANQENTDIDSEYFTEMFSFLNSFLKTSHHPGEAIAAYLFIKELSFKYPHLGTNIPVNFEDLFKGISDIPGIFSSIKDSVLRKELLAHIQKFIPGCADIFVKMFPSNLDVSIIS